MHSLSKEGVVITAQNGIPFWYFTAQDGPYANRRLLSVDPDGSIAAQLPVDRIIGSVVYPAAEIVSPGVIKHIEGLRFSLGELDGTISERATRISSLFRAAGFKSPVVKDIRSEIWTKLWGNLAFNPISALTRTHNLAATMMREAQAIAEKLGIEFKIPLEKRLAGAAEVGAHKTSMLQDLEGGRALETEALIGAVAELGTLVDVPSPAITAVLACLRLLAKTTLPA
jgi:2-dehydropantoate 2-reductase